MSPEIALRLCVLVPFIYAGLYALTDPANSVRLVNKIMAEAHRIEANTILGDYFSEPKPIPGGRGSLVGVRMAGAAMMCVGLLRIYSL
jgi:hypothetical protein